MLLLYSSSGNFRPLIVELTVSANSRHTGHSNIQFVRMQEEQSYTINSDNPVQLGYVLQFVLSLLAKRPREVTVAFSKFRPP